MKYFRLQWHFLFPFRIGVSYLGGFYIINSILQSTLLFYFLLSLSSYSFQSHGILGLQSSYWKLCSCLKKYFSTDYFITFFSPTSSAFCVQGEASLFILTSLEGHLIIPHCDGIRKFFLSGLGQRKCQTALSFITHFCKRKLGLSASHFTKVLMVPEFSWIFTSDYSDGSRPLYCLFSEM